MERKVKNQYLNFLFIWHSHPGQSLNVNLLVILFFFIFIRLLCPMLLTSLIFYLWNLWSDTTVIDQSIPNIELLMRLGELNSFFRTKKLHFIQIVWVTTLFWLYLAFVILLNIYFRLKLFGLDFKIIVNLIFSEFLQSEKVLLGMWSNLWTTSCA